MNGHFIQASRAEEEAANSSGDSREMITPMLRTALEKQGYKLIGTHSGVKLCRWTKVMSMRCNDEKKKQKKKNTHTHTHTKKK